MLFISVTIKTNIMYRVNVLGSRYLSKLLILTHLFFYPTQADKTAGAKRFPFIGGLDGDRCTDNKTCQFYYANSYCKFKIKKDELKTSPEKNNVGRCSCEQGYVSNNRRTRCLKANILLGEPCDETSQCQACDDNLSCDIWDSSNQICAPGSGICDCLPGFYPSDNLRMCFYIVNDLGRTDCSDDLQCQLGKPGSLSQCVEYGRGSKKVCKCKPGAVSSSFGTTCYPVAKYAGDKCEIHAQCTAGLKYSRCMDKRCECNRGYEQRQSDSYNICYPV